MAQTLFGEGAFRGLASENANDFIASNVSCRAQEEEVLVEDHIGEVTGLALGNQSAEVTLSGITKTAATLGHTLGAIMGTLANSAIYGISTVTQFYCPSVSLTRVNKQYETGEMTFRGWTTLTDATGTEFTGL